MYMLLFFYFFLFSCRIHAQRIAVYHLHKTSPDTGNYETDNEEPQPSEKCLGRHLPHPFDTGLDTSYDIDVTSMCHGKDFTRLKLVENNRVQLDMSDCPSQPTWGLSMKKSGSNVWKKKVVIPRSKIKGVDFVYSKCHDMFKSFRGSYKTYSNLKIQPYRLPNLKLTKSTELKPNVLVLMLDSLSWKRMELFLPKSFAFLKGLPNAYAFKFTSVMGKNTPPNTKVAFGNGDVFKRARGMVTSLFEDYSPEHVVAKMYPFKHYKISGNNIMSNYGNDMVKLYHKNSVPGCMHGEFWIQQHLKYIQKFWDIYPSERKFHVSKTYGCHSERSQISTCKQNDVPLRSFLEHYRSGFPNTYLFLMSDHGFHWSKKGKFNEVVSGEYEHRNPILYIVSPKRNENLERNAERFVSHRDVHRTLLGLLSGKSSGKGFNLITEQIPPRRSCKDAGVPKKWCNCFVSKKGRVHLDSLKGQI